MQDKKAGNRFALLLKDAGKAFLLGLAVAAGVFILLLAVGAVSHGFSALAGLELARRGGARCVLTCVRPLEAEELEKLRAALCRLHHKKEVVFDVRTDPALLGGFTLDIEGVRYDKSVRGALGRMGRQLEERRMA